jgi:hypothetical protein
VSGYYGIRAKRSGPGEAGLDFVVDGPESHGRSGVMHLYGIESPGLTAGLSPAQAVADGIGRGLQGRPLGGAPALSVLFGARFDVPPSSGIRTARSPCWFSPTGASSCVWLRGQDLNL